VANSLILFTPRTGSSILADLLAFKYGAWNVDEILAHQVRPQILKKLPPEIIAKIKQGSFNARERIQDKRPEEFYYAMSNEILRSFAFVKELMKENDVVIKCYTYPAALPQKVIQFAIENKFEIYFLYRKNKEEQLRSIVTAMIKEKHGNQKPWSGHIYTNTSEPIDIAPQVYNEKLMHNMAFQIGTSIHTWYCLNQAYKHHGITMCYEDTIAKGDFTTASISNDLFMQYQQQNEFLVPTKNKLTNLISNWDELKPIINNYIIANE